MDFIFSTIFYSWDFSSKKYYQNPIGGGIEIADPFVLEYDGKYYMYGTSVQDGFKYWLSDNLVDWQKKDMP